MTSLSPSLTHMCLPLLVFGAVSTSHALGQTNSGVLQRAPVPGGHLEFELRGDGEPVVLIHGSVIAEALLPLSTEPALSDYQLIRLHRRGYAGSSEVGESFGIDQDAADVVALLRYLGLQRAHIFGHSAGGIVATEFAASFPDMVQT